MVKIKKRKLGEASIPTGSMADIAFLLLLFFLVSTVIDVDTGIGLTLPEYVPPEEQEFVEISSDRMAALLINENGDVLLDGDVIAIPQIQQTLEKRIREKINLPATRKLVVSVKTDRKTNYNLYIQALDEVMGAYQSVRDEYSQQQYGRQYNKLNEEQTQDVRDKIPLNVSIAEPEKV